VVCGFISISGIINKYFYLNENRLGKALVSTKRAKGCGVDLSSKYRRRIAVVAARLEPVP
jgi:hypothetical protein